MDFREGKLDVPRSLVREPPFIPGIRSAPTNGTELETGKLFCVEGMGVNRNASPTTYSYIHLVTKAQIA